jgi:chorismate mutase
MDNRINQIRRKISVLRSKMLAEEVAVRDQVHHDLDCTESSLRLMAMRAELALLIAEWKAAGGSDRLPTIAERLTEDYRPVGRKPVKGTPSRRA